MAVLYAIWIKHEDDLRRVMTAGDESGHEALCVVAQARLLSLGSDLVDAGHRQHVDRPVVPGSEWLPFSQFKGQYGRRVHVLLVLTYLFTFQHT